MPLWPNKAWLGAGTALLLIAIPALGQESPESLLPPGFGDPQTLPPPEDKARPAPRPQPQQGVPGPTSGSPTLQELTNPEAEGEEANPLERPRPSNYFSIPDGVARPVDLVGPLEPGNFGLGRDAFGAGNGAMLGTLMRRLDAPLPSRWTSILLRRVLLSRLDAPAGINPVDWVAERADLLLRMGEADGARMLVQSVDQENYTPRMIEVAAQTALATADPAALCPIVGPARAMSSDGVWLLSEAMCAALEGEAARASALADQARNGGAGGIDLALAEKVIGSGAETRRASVIDWQGVSELTPWRFGLASATGAEIPPALVAGAGPRIQAWFARSPMLPLEQRLDAASVAASLGVFSSHSLVEIYSLMLDQTDPADLGGSVGQRLRLAWAGRDLAGRVGAMRGLWDDPEARQHRYARLILTAGAAARIPASPDFASDADNLVASMLSAGLDRQAARWGGVVQDNGDGRGWAMLAVAAPGPAVEVTANRVEAYVGSDGGRRAQMLVAALAGLGRISEADAGRLAGAAGVPLGSSDAWGAAIDRAAQARQPGAVVLLAGVGMQTGSWSGVPPHYLFRIVRALRTVGLDYEARMIAAEAIARL